MIIQKRDQKKSFNPDNCLIVSFRRVETWIHTIIYLSIVAFSLYILFFGQLVGIWEKIGIGVVSFITLILSYLSCANWLNEQQIWFIGELAIVQEKPIPRLNWGGQIQRGKIVEAVADHNHTQYGTAFGVAYRLTDGTLKSIATVSDESDAEIIIKEINMALALERGFKD